MQATLDTRSALETELNEAIKSGQLQLFSSRKSMPAAAWWALRRCCAGNIRSAAWCHRANSLGWQKRPA